MSCVITTHPCRRAKSRISLSEAFAGRTLDTLMMSTPSAASAATVKGDRFISARNFRGIVVMAQADKAEIWSETTQAA